MSPVEMPALLKGAGLAGLLDIFFMSLFIYAILVWFKRTKAAFVLTGIFIIGGVYLVARACGSTRKRL